MRCYNCKDHRVHLRTRSTSAVVAREVVVVGTGQMAYLWLGNGEGKFLTTLSGAATLRKVAKAILKEVSR